MRSILAESSEHMVSDIFKQVAGDMHVIVCGSPRVGFKSTLINALFCGRLEVAPAGEGLASVETR